MYECSVCTAVYVAHSFMNIIFSVHRFAKASESRHIGKHTTTAATTMTVVCLCTRGHCVCVLQLNNIGLGAKRFQHSRPNLPLTLSPISSETEHRRQCEFTIYALDIQWCFRNVCSSSMFSYRFFSACAAVTAIAVQSIGVWGEGGTRRNEMELNKRRKWICRLFLFFLSFVPSHSPLYNDLHELQRRNGTTTTTTRMRRSVFTLSLASKCIILFMHFMVMYTM